MLILHYTSLMTACALIDIRRDDDDLHAPMTVNYEDPYFFRAQIEKEMDKNPTAKKAEDDEDAELNRQITEGGHFQPPAGSSAKPSMAGPKASGRLATVPLQAMLQTRRNLQLRYAPPASPEPWPSPSPSQCRALAASPHRPLLRARSRRALGGPACAATRT